MKELNEDETQTMITLKENPNLLMVIDYETALKSQGGCNATGLINALVEVTRRIWNTARYLNKGTEWVNQHPIIQLYVYQLAYLCHDREPIEWAGFHDAYKFCVSVKEACTAPEFDYTLEIGNPCHMLGCRNKVKINPSANFQKYCQAHR